MAAAAALVALVLSVAALAGGPTELPLEDRLAVAARASLIAVGWVVAVVGNLARMRFFSTADLHAAAAPSESEAVRIQRAILQNTVEQALIAVPVYGALALLLPAPRMGVLY